MSRIRWTGICSTRSLRITVCTKASAPRLNSSRAAQGTESPAKARKADRQCFFGKRAGWMTTEVYEASALVGGNKIAGPALIDEAGSTILVPNNARAEVDAHGNYLIHV